MANGMKTSMDEQFAHIDIENDKVKRIIRAAFEVFSNNDFEKASTNEIVKIAGISRGLLYHYFEDKQQLFDFLIDYSINLSSKMMKGSIDWQGTDLLARIRQSVVVRLKMMKDYPYIIAFYERNNATLDHQKIEVKIKQADADYRQRFYTHNIDLSGIKDGVDIEKMRKVTTWTMRGLMEEYIDAGRLNSDRFDENELIEKCDEYLAFLKSLFYQ
jgi:TetR/AcrR family transcriptional regulator